MAETPQVIDRFVGRYRYLSNFAPASVRLADHWYPTVEHAYQAAKTYDRVERTYVREAPTPGIAKYRGKSVTLSRFWDEERLGVMYDLLTQKFTTIEPYRLGLLSTGAAELVEGNTWRDYYYWGVCDGRGENHLGKLLMRVRAELSRG